MPPRCSPTRSRCRIPAAPQPETDATLQSQLDALDTLLSDPAPAVRAVAVRGAGRWLSVFWEMMPREVHLALLRRLLKLSHDCNAPAVRAAVCDAFAFVLTQHLAQPLLAQALPKLEHLVDDRAALVRTAFLNLMLEVKKVKAIKFYHTAAPDRLLARLAIDDAARANAVVCELLQPTFFAHAKPARQQAERALFLLHTQPDTAPKFFAGACAVAGSSAAARLIGYLTRRLVRALEQGPVPVDAIGDDVQHVFINDFATVAALLRTINAMWLAIRPIDGARKKPQRAKKANSDEIVTLLHSLWTDDLLCQLWLF
jgi:condensin-2 complex subunit G2